MRSRRATVAVAVAVIAWSVSLAGASWEASVRGVADSNVTRSVREETADTFLGGTLGYSRDRSGEGRLVLTVATTVDGAPYGTLTELSYVSLSLAPGIVYVPFAGWTVVVSPWLQGKMFEGDDQSAVVWGARVEVRQLFGAGFFLSEQDTYTDSQA